jgi:hypothetical protein
MMTRTTRSTKDDIVLEKPSNDDDEEEEENKEGLLRLTFQIWRHQAETEKQTQLLHIVLEKKQMELLKFSLHRRALRYQRACFTRWREEVERTKIQNKRLKSKVEGLRLRYLRAAFDRWRKERMSGKRLKERLARATSRRAMKLQREMFERWRMEAREKRKEREESRDVEREVKELNERMEALQKQFEKEKEQWKEEETRIANAHEAKLEEFTKANENEKLRVATERASRDAETKQKFEAEIALLKLKEEQGRKTYEERKERLIERAVGAMEKEKKERLARKFFTKWREQTMEAKRWKRTLRFLLLKKRRSVIESAFREWKEATETSREEREKDRALERRLENHIRAKRFRVQKRIFEDVFVREYERGKSNERKAAAFRNSQLQEKAFEQMRTYAKRSKIVTNLQARAISRMSSKKVAKAFYIWRNETRTQGVENPRKAEVHFETKMKPELLKRTFSQWKMVSDVEKRFRMLENDAMQKYDSKILKETLQFWHKKTVARRKALSQERKLDRAIMFRERSKMREVFRAWRTLAVSEKKRDETLVRTLKTKKHYERHFAQPFANWKALTEKRRSFTLRREEKHRAKVLRAVFMSWKRSAEDSRNRLALTEKFIAQKYRKQQTQLRRDCLLAWNTHVQMLKQTRIEQMKRAVVERAIADESETHFGTPEGIAIVQAAKRFQRRNFLERISSVVFQRWREESAKRNGVLLALKSAFIEENDARRLRAAFRVWRQRAMEMKAKSAWQSSRTPAIAASMSPLKKKTSAKDERNSPKSTASSWDFDVDFEQNARNLKLTNTTFKSMSRKATGTFFGADNTNNRNGRDENTNTNNSSSSRFSALDRSYRETIDACIALEAKLEMKGSATRTSSQCATPRKDASSSTVPTTRESREFKQNALKEKLMDIEASAMALLESARATRVRREKLHQQQQQAQSSF